MFSRNLGALPQDKVAVVVSAGLQSSPGSAPGGLASKLNPVLCQVGPGELTSVGRKRLFYNLILEVIYHCPILITEVSAVSP